MKTTVNVYDFREAFKRMGRENFSYEGLGILFDWLEETQGDDMELDVIAICCDFAEESPREIAGYYSVDIDGLDDNQVEAAVREALEEECGYVGTTEAGKIIYCQNVGL